MIVWNKCDKSLIFFRRNNHCVFKDMKVNISILITCVGFFEMMTISLNFPHEMNKLNANYTNHLTRSTNFKIWAIKDFTQSFI